MLVHLPAILRRRQCDGMIVIENLLRNLEGLGSHGPIRGLAPTKLGEPQPGPIRCVGFERRNDLLRRAADAVLSVQGIKDSHGEVVRFGGALDGLVVTRRHRVSADVVHRRHAEAMKVLDGLLQARIPDIVRHVGHRGRNQIHRARTDELPGWISRFVSDDPAGSLENRVVTDAHCVQRFRVGESTSISFLDIQRRIR